MIEAMAGFGAGFGAGIAADLDGAGGGGFAASELFERTFREGMALVEDAAAYLDGEGRQASKRLGRDAALAYASHSMTLTTRLMQVASWLLVQRAVREGEMSAVEAADARYRVGEPAAAPTHTPSQETMPTGLTKLTERAERLFERIAHLDRRLYLDAPPESAANSVLSQFDRLREAFATG